LRKIKENRNKKKKKKKKRKKERRTIGSRNKKTKSNN